MKLVDVIITTNTRCKHAGTHEISLATAFLQYAFGWGKKEYALYACENAENYG